MEKEFVPYNQALRLKGLGFNEACFGYFDCERDFKFVQNKTKYLDCEIPRPTFSQCFRWFREKHDIVSYIKRFEDNTFDYECNSPKFKEVIDFEDGPFDTYEEAELACLERLIDKITNKKIFDFVTEL